jgi:hypothetical protein
VKIASLSAEKKYKKLIPSSRLKDRECILCLVYKKGALSITEKSSLLLKKPKTKTITFITLLIIQILCAILDKFNIFHF